MIKLRIRKFGTSLGLILPKEAIERLRTGQGDQIFLVEAGNGDYKLTRHDPAFKQKMAKATKIMGRYRKTLGSLAK